MLKILYRLDELDSSEHNLVADASNRLEVGEFQFFQLSFLAWYGREADTAFLERAFFGYMLENRVPHWARHYAREIIRRDDEGVLAPYAPEYHQFDRTYKPPPASGHGWPRRLAVFLLLGALLALAFVALTLYTGTMVPPGVTCFFPPCSW